MEKREFPTPYHGNSNSVLAQTEESLNPANVPSEIQEMLREGKWKLAPQIRTEDFRAILKKILAKPPQDLSSTKREFETFLGKSMDEKNYAKFLLYFCTKGILENIDREVLKRCWVDYFYDPLKQIWYANPILAISFEGAEDLVVEEYKDLLSLKNSAIPDIVRKIYYHSRSDRPFIIVGESGTSKELVCKAIHNISKRRLMPIEAINCAAIPNEMLETELFGHEKGAFTGAAMKKLGRFELANGGTVFLDELGKMPQALQAKILRVVQEGNFRRVGNDKEVTRIDVRFIAATQPHDLVNILQDLKFRLGFPNIIKLPTLNERLKKVPDLIINKFLSSITRPKFKEEGYELTISKECLDRLLNYQYAGGYRELENILRAGLILAKDDGKKTEINNLSFLDDQLISSEDRIKETNYPLKSSWENIPLRNIVEHAERVKASIIEEKVVSILEGGRNLKSVFLSEGQPEKEYQNFWKKITRITGKGIRDLEAAAKKQSKPE